MSIVDFMGLFCSRKQFNGFYRLSGTSRYMGFKSCHLRWLNNNELIKCTAPDFKAVQVLTIISLAHPLFSRS